MDTKGGGSKGFVSVAAKITYLNFWIFPLLCSGRRKCVYILTTLLSQQKLSLKKCVKWFMWKGQKIFREEIIKWYLIHMQKFKEFSSWFKTTFEFDYLNLKPFPSSQTKVSRRTKYLKLIKSLTSHARQITQIWKSLKRYISNPVFYRVSCILMIYKFHYIQLQDNTPCIFKIVQDKADIVS